MTARPLLLLGVGAVVGATVAVIGLVTAHRRAPALPADAAARHLRTSPEPGFSMTV